MFEDEAVANLDRDFTKLELSLIIEALIAYKGMGMRPDFDSIDTDAIQNMDDVFELEIPARPFTDNEGNTIAEMMILFMAGFGKVIDEEQEMIDEGGKELVSEISDFLRKKQ